MVRSKACERGIVSDYRAEDLRPVTPAGGEAEHPCRGAVGAGDIGVHFPPSDPQWKGAPSSRFVEHAVSLLRQAGYRVNNIDLTLICEAPKIGAYREAMRGQLASLAQVDLTAVNIKATTTEQLGFTGRGEGIAAQAVATLVRS